MAESCKLLVCMLDQAPCSGEDESCRQKRAFKLSQPAQRGYRGKRVRRKRATTEELIDIARSIHGDVYQTSQEVMLAFGYSPHTAMMDSHLENLGLVEYSEGGYRINGFPEVNDGQTQEK